MPRAVLAVAVGVALSAPVLVGDSEPAAAVDPCTKTWDGGAGSANWQDGANWAPDGVPGAADVACIPAGASVLLRNIVVNVGAVDVDGTLTVNGQLNVAGESEASDIRFEFATFDVFPALGGTGSLTVSTGGTMTWSHGDITLTGGLDVADGGTLEIVGGSTRSLATNLRNDGTVEWSGGIVRLVTTASTVHPMIVNQGAFEVDLSLGGQRALQWTTGPTRGSLESTVDGASITVSNPTAADASFQLFGTASTIDGLSLVGARVGLGGTATTRLVGDGATIDATSVLSNDDSFLVVEGSVSGAGTLRAGSSTTLEATATIDLPHVTVPGPTNFVNNIELAVPLLEMGPASVFGAPLMTGPGAIRVGDGAQFLSHGGTIAGTGALVVDAGGELRAGGGVGANTNISRPVDVTGTVHVTGARTTITGAITQLQGTTLTGGTWEVDAGAELRIPTVNIFRNEATVSLHGNAAFFGDGGAALRNLGGSGGTLRLLDGADLTLAGGLQNDGVIDLSPTTVLDTAFFTQTSGGRFVARLAGSSAAPVAPSIETGAIDLAGTLELDVPDGFAAPIPDVRIIDGSGLDGAFSSVVGGALPEGNQLGVRYDGAAGDVYLSVGSAGDCTTTYLGPAGGDWAVAANWSTGVVPGPADVACLPSSVESSGDVTVDGVRGDDGATLTIDGGTFTVTDRLEADAVSVTGGRLELGSSGAIDDYEQGAAGTLGVTLDPDAGLGPVLDVTTATLAGHLAIGTAAAATPSAGDEAVVLRASATRSGSFATVTGPVGPGLAWEADHRGLEVVGVVAAADVTHQLQVVPEPAGPEPGTFVLDGSTFEQLLDRSGTSGSLRVAADVLGLQALPAVGADRVVDASESLIAFVAPVAEVLFPAGSASPFAGVPLELLVLADWDDADVDTTPAVTVALRATDVSLSAVHPAWRAVAGATGTADLAAISLASGVVALRAGATPATLAADALPSAVRSFLGIFEAGATVALEQVATLIGTVQVSTHETLARATAFVGGATAQVLALQGGLAESAAHVFDRAASVSAAAFALTAEVAVDAAVLPAWLVREAAVVPFRFALEAVGPQLVPRVDVHDAFAALGSTVEYVAALADVASFDLTVGVDAYVPPYGLGWIDVVEGSVELRLQYDPDAPAWAATFEATAQAGASQLDFRFAVADDPAATHVQVDVDGTVALPVLAAWIGAASAFGDGDFDGAGVASASFTFDTSGLGTVLGLTGRASGIPTFGGLTVDLLLGVEAPPASVPVVLAAIGFDCDGGCRLSDVLPVPASFAADMVLPSLHLAHVSAAAGFDAARLGDPARAMLEAVQGSAVTGRFVVEGALAIAVDVGLTPLDPLLETLHLGVSTTQAHLLGTAGFGLELLDGRLSGALLDGMRLVADFPGLTAGRPAALPDWVLWPAATAGWQLVLAAAGTGGGALTIGAEVVGIELDDGLGLDLPPLTLRSTFEGAPASDPTTWTIDARAEVGTWTQPFGIGFLTLEEAFFRLTVSDEPGPADPVPSAAICGTFTVGPATFEVCAAIAGTDPLSATLSAELRSEVTFEDVLVALFGGVPAGAGDVPPFLLSARVGADDATAPPTALTFQVTGEGQFSVDVVADVGFTPFAEEIGGGLLLRAEVDGPSRSVTFGVRPHALSLSQLLPDGVLPDGLDFDLVPAGTPNTGFAIVFSTGGVDLDAPTLPEPTRQFFLPVVGGDLANRSIPSGFSVLGAFRLPSPLDQLVAGIGIDPNVLMSGTLPLPGQVELHAAFSLTLRLASTADLPEFVTGAELSLSAAVSVGLPTSFSLSLSGDLFLRFKQGLEPCPAVDDLCALRNAPLEAIGFEPAAAVGAGFDCPRGGAALPSRAGGPRYCYDQLALGVSGSLELTIPAVSASLAGSLRSTNADDDGDGDPDGWAPLGVDVVRLGDLTATTTIGFDPTKPFPLTLLFGLSGSGTFVIPDVPRDVSVGLQVGVGVNPSVFPPAVSPMFDGFRFAIPQGFGTADLVEVQRALAGAIGAPPVPDALVSRIPDVALRNLYFSIGTTAVPAHCIEPGFSFRADLYVDPDPAYTTDWPVSCNPDTGIIPVPTEDTCEEHTEDGCLAGVIFSLSQAGLLADAFLAPFPPAGVDSPIRLDEIALRLSLRPTDVSLLVRGGATVDGLGEGRLALSLAPTGGSFYGYLMLFEGYRALVRADLDLTTIRLDAPLPDGTFTAVLEADFAAVVEEGMQSRIDALIDQVRRFEEAIEALRQATMDGFAGAAAAIGIDLPAWVDAFQQGRAAIEGDIAEALEGAGTLAGLDIEEPTVREIFEGGTATIRHNGVAVCGAGEHYSASRRRCVDGDGASKGVPGIVCAPGFTGYIASNGAVRCRLDITVVPLHEIVGIPVPADFDDAMAELAERAVDTAVDFVENPPSLSDLLDQLEVDLPGLALTCASFTFETGAAGGAIEVAVRVAAAGSTYGFSTVLDDLDLQSAFEEVVRQALEGPANVDCTTDLSPPNGVESADELLRQFLDDQPTSLLSDVVVEGGSTILSVERPLPTIAVDWGDGSAVEVHPVTSPIQVPHVFADDPSGEARRFLVEVTDAATGELLSSHETTVLNLAPTDVDGAFPPPNLPVLEGFEPTTEVTWSDAGLADTHEVRIEWGDGLVQELPVPLPVGARTAAFPPRSPAPRFSGSMSVCAVVEDDDGGIGTSCGSVTFQDRAAQSPTLVPRIPAIRAGVPATFDLAWTDVGPDDVHCITFDWGDGSVTEDHRADPDVFGRSVSVQHTFPPRTTATTYSVVVRIVDCFTRAITTRTFPVRVSGSPPPPPVVPPPVPPPTGVFGPGGTRPPVIRPGSTVTVVGTGFAPVSPVTVTLFSDPVDLGSFVADADGVVRAEVTIPLDTPPGEHTIELKGVDPDGNQHIVRFPVSIEAPAPGAARGGVARTGADSGPITIAGVSLVLFGLVLTSAGRRRRPGPDLRAGARFPTAS